MLENESEIVQEGFKIGEEITDEEIDTKLKPKDDLDADSQPAKDDKEPSQEGDKESEDEDPKNTPDENKLLPFNNHPRFKQLTKENRELKEYKAKAEEQQEENSRRLSEIENRQKVADEPQPEWFAGDDKEWKEFQTKQIEDRTSFKKEIIAEVKPVKEAKEDWDAWVDTQVQGLTDEGKKFNRNELLKVMVDYQPTDSDGNLDFQKGFNLYQKLSAKAEAKPKEKEIGDKDKRKAIASKTTPSSKPEGNEKPFGTTQNLRHRSFTSLARED